MFAFAVVVDPEHPAECALRTSAMLDAWPHVPPDDRAVAHAPRAAAGVLRWNVLSRDGICAPFWDEQRRQLVAGDVRLYNRADLTAALDLDRNCLSDLSLAFHAYVRWGRMAPARMIGDYAFAVWDEESGSLFAARDHLGVRPLYYRVEGRRIYLASDIAQILPVASGLAVNGRAILERFSSRTRTHETTFFKDIFTLPGGHSIELGDRGLHKARYWAPPRERKNVSYLDECQEIRALFLESVKARLDSDRPILAHSSGGFDSSTIVLAADAVYRGEGHRAPLTMVSATTPGMPCDDSLYMDAVARQVRFENERWNAFSAAPATFADVSLSEPTLHCGIGGGARADLATARSKGARVLLTGLCGDTVVYSFGIFRDMFRNGLVLDVAAQAIRRGSWRVFLSVLGKASLGLLSPKLALRSSTAWSNRQPRTEPRWMGPSLRSLFPAAPEKVDAFEGASSHMAAETWARIGSPAMADAIHGMVAYGALEGLEVRIPYIDPRLIQRVLEIPWEHRVPRGDFRRLGRDALGSLLPAEFQMRLDQGSWAGVWAHHARQMLPAIQELITDGSWLSAPYLEHAEVLRLHRRVTANDGPDLAQDLIMLNEFAILESWLRRVRRTTKCDMN